MTSVEMLTGFAFTTPLGVSVAAGWQQAGIYGVFAGLAVGFGLGLGGFFTMRALGRWMDRHPSIYGTEESIVWLALAWLLFLGIILGVFGLSFLGTYLTATLLHHALA